MLEWLGLRDALSLSIAWSPKATLPRCATSSSPAGGWCGPPRGFELDRAAPDEKDEIRKFRYQIFSRLRSSPNVDSAKDVC